MPDTKRRTVSRAVEMKAAEMSDGGTQMRLTHGVPV
jgi:hypothetical protein